MAFKWSGWNRFTRNKLNQIAADASAGGGGDSGGGGEGGGGGGAAPFIVGVVHKVGDSGQRRTDKTVQEVLDAIEAGQAIVVHDDTNTDTYFFGPRVQVESGSYAMYWETYWYYASTTTGYFEEDMG